MAIIRSRYRLSDVLRSNKLKKIFSLYRFDPYQEYKKNSPAITHFKSEQLSSHVTKQNL